MASHKCTILKISKRLIKQNIFYEQHLLKEIESVSNNKKAISILEKAQKKHQLKKQTQRINQANKRGKSDESTALFKAKLANTNVLHGLQQVSLAELGKKGQLPSFTKQFETFSKQSPKRKKEITDELLESCISHSVTSEADKVRMRKKKFFVQKIYTEGSVYGTNNRSLATAAQDLVDDCHKLLRSESSIKLTENTHHELSVSNFGNKPGLPFSPKTVRKDNRPYFIKQSGPQGSSLLSMRNPKKNLYELSCSGSNLGGSMALKNLTGKYLLNKKYDKKRDIETIKATELFPKIRGLLQDSMSLLTQNRRLPGSLNSEGSLLKLPFSSKAKL